MTWRLRTPSDPPLETLEGSFGPIQGDRRCGVLGLYRGDCPQPRQWSDWLCYYHAKLRDDLCEPEADCHGLPGPIGTSAYPVWPLPERPYVLVTSREAAA